MHSPRSCKTLASLLVSLAFLIFGQPAFAQEDEAPQGRLRRTAVKAFKYADVAPLVEPLAMIGVDATADAKRRVLVLHGPESKMETAVALLDALDTPEPQFGIELMVHVVRAKRGAADGPDIPPKLAKPLGELSELFNYRHFELVDTIFLMATTDSGSARVTAPIRGGAVFDVGFDRAIWIYGEPEQWVQFENLSITAAAENIRMHTNVKVPEGHQVVIGKSSVNGAEDDADLVLVIETRVRWPADDDESNESD